MWLALSPNPNQKEPLGLAHAGADGCEANGEAGADGGERRDPHGAALRRLGGKGGGGGGGRFSGRRDPGFRVQGLLGLGASEWDVRARSFA